MSPQELFEEATRLEDSQPEQALAAWRELAILNPTRNVFLRLGRCEETLGLSDDAEQAFRMALEIDNRSAVALTGLGSLALDRSDYEAAQGYLKRSCDLKQDPGSFTLLGVALRNLGRDLEAEEAYQSAIRIDPKFEEAYYNLGLLLRNGRPSESLALFRKALELDADYAPAHRELGWVLHRQGADPGAEHHIRKAIELTPDDGWAHVYLGTCLWTDDVDLATAEFHRARELDPNWAFPLCSLGSIYESIGDLDLAQSFYERALHVDQDDVVTLANFGRLCKKLGQGDLAKKYLERALLIDPHYGKAQALLSDIANGSPS